MAGRPHPIVAGPATGRPVGGMGVDPWKDPWQSEGHRWGDLGFHLTRLVLFATGTAVWLLDTPRPAPPVAVALAGVLVLDRLAQAAPGPQPQGAAARACWPAVAACGVSLVLTLWAVSRTGALALVGTVAAVVMGSSTVMGPALSRWINAAAGLAAVAAAASAAGLQGALLAGAVLLAAAWNGDVHGLYRAERDRLRQAVAGLAAAQERLTELAARSGQLEAQREREELLGALHDALGHTLTAQLLQVSLARRLLPVDPEGAAARLEAVEEGLRDGLAQVRQMLRRSLHPARLPLASAVQRLASNFSAATGVAVEVLLEPDAASVSDTDALVASVVQRAVQESLTNAVRHGQARRVVVQLTATGPRLRLRVEDDGRGAAELVPGLGLTRMTYGIQRLGGTIRFTTLAGKGFTTEITVPRHSPAGREPASVDAAEPAGWVGDGR